MRVTTSRLDTIQSELSVLVESLESGLGVKPELLLKIRALKQERQEIVDERNKNKWHGRYRDR